MQACIQGENILAQGRGLCRGLPQAKIAQSLGHIWLERVEIDDGFGFRSLWWGAASNFAGDNLVNVAGEPLLLFCS